MTAAGTRAISLTETSKISAHGARNAWSAEGPRTGVARVRMQPVTRQQPTLR